MSMGRGQQFARGTILAGTDVNGTIEVSPKTKKPRRFCGTD